jgi:hypothetical protein
MIYFPVPSREVTNQTLPDREDGKIAKRFLQCLVPYWLERYVQYTGT